MTRALSLLLSSAVLLAPEVRADEVRAIGGEVVTVEEDTVVVFWSMQALDAAELLQGARDLRRCGVDVVTINTDAVSQVSRISPWLRAHGIELSVVMDADGQLQRTYAGAPLAPGTPAVDGMMVACAVASPLAIR